MMNNNPSLYMKIIKAENNAAVIRDIVVAGMNPYLCRIIKALINNDQQNFGKKVFMCDFEKYKKAPDKSYLSTAIFTFSKLVSFLNTPIKCISKFSKEKLKDLKYNDLKAELVNAKIEFKEFDLDELDTAGIIKVINDRIDFDHDTMKLLWKTLGNLSELRNEYEGHLTQKLKIECSSETVITKVNLLVADLVEGANSLETKIAVISNQTQQEILKKCRQQLLEAKKFLESVKETIENISSCSIIKDSAIKYTATNLLGYIVFAVYPDINSNKFRRFCNEELMYNQTLKGDCIYTDIGTVSQLEAYALSKNEGKRNEAKQILKELFAPMLRKGTLKVLKFDDVEENDDYIDISGPSDEERFINTIQQINGNICVITDDPFVANSVWKLNANKDIKNFSAVAVKVYNKQQIVPFYD